MKRTIPFALVLGAAVAVSPTLAGEQPAVHAPAGPVVLSEAELDRVVGGDASCVGCNGQSVSNNESTVTIVVGPGHGDAVQVWQDQAAGGEATCYNCSGSSVSNTETTTVTIVVGR